MGISYWKNREQRILRRPRDSLVKPQSPPQPPPPPPPPPFTHHSLRAATQHNATLTLYIYMCGLYVSGCSGPVFNVRCHRTNSDIKPHCGNNAVRVKFYVDASLGGGGVIKPLSPRRPPSFLKSSWIHGFRHVARALAKVTTERRVNRGVNAFIYQHPQRHHALESQMCQAILHRQPPAINSHISLSDFSFQTNRPLK